MWLVGSKPIRYKINVTILKTSFSHCFCTNDVMFRALCHLLTPPCHFSIFEDLGGWQPCPYMQARAPRNFGSHVTVCLSIHLSQGHQCPISPFLASVWACNLILHLHVVINWQLSIKGTHWPVSHDCVTGSGVPPLFFNLSTDKLQVVFSYSQAPSGFLWDGYKLSVYYNKQIINF